jgi:predicted phage terminase large subunit-like protein
LTTDAKGTSQLLGIGTGGSLTGKHFDFIFTNDIINIQDRISKADRERTKMIYQELQNIKNRGGRIFNTLTPWHKDDASTLMPEPKKYDCYSTGLISKEEIEEIKSKMIPSLFSANYELKHIASEDVIFTNPQYTDNKALCQQGIAQVDAGFYGEDYTALTIVCKKDGKYYVHGRCWRKHVEECYADIKLECEKYMISKLHIEKNADKGLVARDLKNIGLRVNAYNESMNKYMKIVTYLKIEWNNVIFDTDTDEEYIEQICDYNENASHDDCPDSLSSAIRVLYNKTGDKYQPLFM